eukprot:scaffold108753_cov17-Prasinocladus_malaysianus.AAC.1
MECTPIPPPCTVSRTVLSIGEEHMIQACRAFLITSRCHIEQRDRPAICACYQSGHCHHDVSIHHGSIQNGWQYDLDIYPLQA